MGHGFGSPEIYSYATSRLYSQNIYEKALAQIIYATTRSEQDAMINGLYAKIKSGYKERFIDDIVKESEAFAWLENLYGAYETLCSMKNKPEVLKFATPYTKINKHYDYSKFCIICRKGIKEFEWKLARLIKGCKKKFMLENNIRPYISGKHLYRDN